MTGIDDLLASFTARQHGLVARWQAYGVGVSKQQLDHRARCGDLIRVFHDVYRLRGVPFTRELRWLAAVLAGGDGALLSHEAAAVKHHYDIAHVRPVVSTPHARHPEIDGVTWHRTRRHTGLDIVTIDGIRMTARPRTLLDCAAVLPYERLLLLVQDAVARGLVEVEQLMAIVDRRGGRGVSGTVAMRAALEDGLVDDKIESKLELLLARILATLPVPAPVRQHEMTCADGRSVRLDNAWPELRVSVEGDGRRWHGNKYQAAKSRTRSRSITASGWQHYVYGWSEAMETPHDVADEVTRAVLGRLRMPRAC